MAVTDDQRIHLGVTAARIGARGVAALVDMLEPDALPPCDATDMWEAFDRIERLAANAELLLAARVEASGAWKCTSARSAAEHLARLGGTSTQSARRPFVGPRDPRHPRNRPPP